MVPAWKLKREIARIGRQLTFWKLRRELLRVGKQATSSFSVQLTFWKLRRELLRVGKQATSSFSVLCEYFFATPYYDCYLARQKTVHSGQLKASDKVAIYLIFPQNGLLPSHLAALKYMAENGYAPLVVSNSKLPEATRELLLRNCWRYIERPNFGYDFGGYRDGVLYALDAVKNLKFLALFNDSTWFPLPNSSNWLADAESLNVDFAGAASNYGAERIDFNRFREIKWKYRGDHKNFHYCSFALLFSNRVLQDPQFFSFWKKFHLSQSKNRTVRRGEIGLTQFVLRHGYSHGSTCDIRDLDVQLAALSNTRLTELVQNILIPEHLKLFEIKGELLDSASSSQEWLETAAKFIMTAVVLQGSSYALADYTIREKKFPFLKKSPVWLNEDSSNVTLEIAGRLEGELGEIILQEVADLRERRLGNQ